MLGDSNGEKEQYLNTQNCAKLQIHIFWNVTKNLAKSSEETKRSEK